ncbi:Hypothetical predicted protein [Octopus vulgaris]|uniref:Uncharacterized protein n=1 Tax=Octopus vulgaris TaxID=6645 RepID=A0AA36B6N9_OCTVU|nr:Hypothetical predicted protein [Octopus vulgaris]
MATRVGGDVKLSPPPQKIMDNKLNMEKRNFADVAKCQEKEISIEEFGRHKDLISREGFEKEIWNHLVIRCGI